MKTAEIEGARRAFDAHSHRAAELRRQGTEQTANRSLSFRVGVDVLNQDDWNARRGGRKRGRTGRADDSFKRENKR